MREYQILWKKKFLPHITKKGYQNGKAYDHIIPRSLKEENFYLPIRKELFDKENGYLAQNHIQPHTGIHNLLSSWTVCANMYWPFNNQEGKKLLSRWLSKETKLDVLEISQIELEYEDPVPGLNPGNLLGENSQGKRGSGQTSPDLAIKFKTSNSENGILLIESKFTEHSFYVCSGYQKKTMTKNVPNPNKDRCLDTGLVLSSEFKECHLNVWGRKYWNLIGMDADRSVFVSLKRCPMSTSCYQLFRQQALAKGFKDHYDIVVSCVVSDERNTILVNSGKSVGLSSFPEGWKKLFPSLPFYWFTHNSWYKFVKGNNPNGIWDKWLEYIGIRYDL